MCLAMNIVSSWIYFVGLQDYFGGKAVITALVVLMEKFHWLLSIYIPSIAVGVELH